jgi:hypothetical protein
MKDLVLMRKANYKLAVKGVTTKRRELWDHEEIEHFSIRTEMSIISQKDFIIYPDKGSAPMKVGSFVSDMLPVHL